jgi:hypothetical protein
MYIMLVVKILLLPCAFETKSVSYLLQYCFSFWLASVVTWLTGDLMTGWQASVHFPHIGKLTNQQNMCGRAWNNMDIYIHQPCSRNNTQWMHSVSVSENHKVVLLSHPTSWMYHHKSSWCWWFFLIDHIRQGSGMVAIISIEWWYW